jgi:hypothetical protein
MMQRDNQALSAKMRAEVVLILAVLLIVVILTSKYVWQRTRIRAVAVGTRLG